MKTLRLAILLLIVLATILMAVPAHADTANPDVPPTITRMKVYRNLAESGDQLYIWEAEVRYATPPTTKFSDTFIWQLIDTDGTTILGAVTGYSYNDDGYGFAVYGLYFPAATAPTWGQVYTLRLSGNPTVFTTPPQYNFSVLASYYFSSTDHQANQAALADEVLELAFDLNHEWGLTGDAILTLEMETETVLSLIGEDYFRGSIRGLQTLAPAAFRFVLENLYVPHRSWNNSYVTGLENQYQGSWIQVAKNASRDFLATDYDLMSIIIMFGLCIALVFINLSLTSDIWNALIDITFILTIGARLGAYSLIYLGLIAAVAVIFIGSKIWRQIPT